MLGYFKKSKPAHQNDNPISRVAAYLEIMGYELTPYGAGVALLECKSGYNEVETASHIAFTTMALDIKESGNNARKLMPIFLHGHALLEVLKEYKDKGMIHPAQWQNDSLAIFRIATPDMRRNQWIEEILNDPLAGKERLAKSRINYDSLPSG
jgi:hypothetical protein